MVNLPMLAHLQQIHTQQGTCSSSSESKYIHLDAEEAERTCSLFVLYQCSVSIVSCQTVVGGILHLCYKVCGFSVFLITKQWTGNIVIWKSFLHSLTVTCNLLLFLMIWYCSAEWNKQYWVITCCDTISSMVLCWKMDECSDWFVQGNNPGLLL